MTITSPGKGVLEVNDEICKILGYERGELLRMTWAELTHPDDLAVDVAQFNRIMAGEIDGYSLDKRWIRKDGQVIDSTISVKCLRRADGSVDYFVALLQDITERKRSEEALRRARDELEQRVADRTSQLSAINDQLMTEIMAHAQAEETLRRSEERFRLLLEGVGDYAIFMLSPDGRVMTWAKGAERIKGYLPEDILGQHFSVFYDHNDIQMGKPEQGLQAAAATGRFEDEGWRYRKDGSRFWARVIITALTAAR
jgi:PAS domain S-box-containing protein